MKSVTASKARTKFGQLLQRVSQGEEVIITRYEKPVARLVPEQSRNLELASAAVAEIFDLRRQISDHNLGKPKLTASEVKAWADYGRH